MQVKYKDANSHQIASWDGTVSKKEKSHMVLIEKIFLSDDLIAEVWDQSRTIASDTVKVDLLFRMKFDLAPSYFDDMEHFERVKKVYGMKLCYEHKIEKSFVKHSEKGTIIKNLLESFKKHSLPYFSKPTFPRQFALSKYRDIVKNLS